MIHLSNEGTWRGILNFDKLGEPGKKKKTTSPRASPEVIIPVAFRTIFFSKIH